MGGGRAGTATLKQPPAETFFGWMRSAEGWLLFLFSFGAMYLNGQNQLRILGILLSGVFLLKFLYPLEIKMARMRPIPPELIAYACWVLWSGITGLYVAEDRQSFWADYRVILQIFVMVVVAFGVLRQYKNALNGVFLGMFCGGLAINGDILLGNRTVVETALGEQLIGPLSNPNTLGIFIILSLLATLLLSGIPERLRKWSRVGGLIFLLLSFNTILESASRKSLIAIFFLFGGWMIFRSSAVRMKEDFFKKILISFVLVTVASVGLPIILQGTVMGARFQEFFGSGQNSIGTAAQQNVRYSMYVDGLKMFAHHPVFGVGLGNFKTHFWEGQYSHSDYIEPLADTGLLGFLLYQSFYFFLLVRAFRLLKHVKDEAVSYRLRIMVIGILTIMLLGFGVVHQTLQAVFLMLAVFSAYTSRIEVDVCRQLRASSSSHRGELRLVTRTVARRGA